jgi:hypothetical protein
MINASRLNLLMRPTTHMSPLLAEGLRQSGHDASHVRDCGLQSAENAMVFAHSREQDRIPVSAIRIRHLARADDASKTFRHPFSQGNRPKTDRQLSWQTCRPSKHHCGKAVSWCLTKRIRVRPLPIDSETSQTE